MYAIVPAYPTLTTELGLSYSQVGLMVSLWFLGYSIAHVPAGFRSSCLGFETRRGLGRPDNRRL
ncbi:hypothetical protein [Yaniella flava]|uniref:hypothetical protein n=1 Tax=Yaniella flava TaxID=287930 RepID=UPI003CD09F75